MNRVQLKIIEEAMDQDRKLSAWECDFVSDMNEKPEEYELSEKQNHILNRIGSKMD